MSGIGDTGLKLRSIRPALALLLFIGLGLVAVSFNHQLTRAVFTDSAAIDLRFQAGFWPSPGPCVRSMGYWKNHPEAWRLDGLSLGGVQYSQDEALGILNTSPKGDATYILAHQLIAALLNVETGADGTDVAAQIADAQVWLAAYSVGTDPGEPDRAEGIALADILEQFNTGQLGPASCDETKAVERGPVEGLTKLYLEADPTIVIADGESKVAIRISIDQDGPETSDPKDVSLKTTLGTFAGGVAEGVVQTSDGQAQITLYVGTVPGTAVITAMLDGSTATVTVEFVEPPSPEPTVEGDSVTPAPSESPTPTDETPTEEPSAEPSLPPTEETPTAEPSDQASPVIEETPTPIPTE